jgi:NADH-quinone oxidoreductase subunit L
VFEHNKILWVLGVVTAILTAYYMSRLFVLTFRGTERFREVTHGHDPHESPWVMTLPLVVLAVLSVLGGLLDLPWIHHDSLAGFLSSTFGYVAPLHAQSTLSQYGLAAVDVAAALIGLAAAISIWRSRTEDERLTPAFLEHVWYWDDFYDATIGRPLEELAVFSDVVVEDEVIDGGVMGLAVGISRSAESVRKIQSGFVRHYALAMMLGTAVLIVFLVARVS